MNYIQKMYYFEYKLKKEEDELALNIYIHKKQLVAEEGMIIFFNNKHSLNAFSSKDVTENGIETSINDEQP